MADHKKKRRCFKKRGWGGRPRPEKKGGSGTAVGVDVTTTGGELCFDET